MYENSHVYKRNKTRSSKQTKQLKQLVDYPTNLRDTVLRLYFDKCLNKYNIAFFKWRENFSIESEELVHKYIERLKKRIEIESDYIDQSEHQNLETELNDIELTSQTLKLPDQSSKFKPNADIDFKNREIEINKIINQQTNLKPPIETSHKEPRNSLIFGGLLGDSKDEDNAEEDQIVKNFDMIGIEIQKGKGSKKNVDVVKSSIHLVNLNSKIVSNKIHDEDKEMKQELENNKITKQETLYKSKEDMIDQLIPPPKLVYRPSIALMREQIMRSLYIKNINTFIEDNRVIEVKLTLEDI